MPHGIVGIDHPLIAVADLEAAKAAWARLGFTVTPRGRHIGWATANYCIMFPNNYVELLGIVDPAGYAAGLADQLAANGEGMLRLAVRLDDAAAAQASLTAAGIASVGPQALSRLLELPEGDVQPAFELLQMAPETLAGLPLFGCRHLTPDLLRQPAWLRHPNGAVNLSSVTALVARPSDWRSVCERLFGIGNVTLTDATLTARIGTGSLVLVSPDDLRVMHPDAVLGVVDGPSRFVGLRFACLDPAHARQWLKRAGVTHSVDPDGTVRVAPPEATGVVVEFGR